MLVSVKLVKLTGRSLFTTEFVLYTELLSIRLTTANVPKKAFKSNKRVNTKQQ